MFKFLSAASVGILCAASAASAAPGARIPVAFDCVEERICTPDKTGKCIEVKGHAPRSFAWEPGDDWQIGEDYIATTGDRPSFGIGFNPWTRWYNDSGSERGDVQSMEMVDAGYTVQDFAYQAYVGKIDGSKVSSGKSEWIYEITYREQYYKGAGPVRLERFWQGLGTCKPTEWTFDPGESGY